MFTGIIENLGQITKIEKEGTNVHFTIASDISKELKIDQSVSHNGVCLTVTACDDKTHTVTAIEETLLCTDLGGWKENATLNLERAMQNSSRLDGHIVQGHVDITGECVHVEERDGSWYYTFKYQPTPQLLLVDKGSVCINGVSLTVVEPVGETFKVAIIPYTHEHTNFHNLKSGDSVNLEFDIIGKYISKYMAAYAAHFNKQS